MNGKNLFTLTAEDFTSRHIYIGSGSCPLEAVKGFQDSYSRVNPEIDESLIDALCLIQSAYLILGQRDACNDRWHMHIEEVPITAA